MEPVSSQPVLSVSPVWAQWSERFHMPASQCIERRRSGDARPAPALVSSHSGNQTCATVRPYGGTRFRSAVTASEPSEKRPTFCRGLPIRCAELCGSNGTGQRDMRALDRQTGGSDGRARPAEGDGARDGDRVGQPIDIEGLVRARLVASQVRSGRAVRPSSGVSHRCWICWVGTSSVIDDHCLLRGRPGWPDDEDEGDQSAVRRAHR